MVAKHIFDKVLDNEHGIARNSVRVLVTHQTQFLHRVNCVVVMEFGSIAHCDTLDNLNKQGINIKSLIDDKDDDDDENDDNGDNLEITPNDDDIKTNTNLDNQNDQSEPNESKADIQDTQIVQNDQTSSSTGQDENNDDENSPNSSKGNDVSAVSDEEINEMAMSKVFTRNTATTIHSSDVNKLQKDEKKLFKKAKDESIVQKEDIATGNVSFKTYLSMFHVANENITESKKTSLQILQLVGLVLLMYSAQLVLTGSEYWLGIWASRNKKEQQRNIYPNVFAILVAIVVVLSVGRAAICFKVLLRGSRYLHDGMFHGVLYSPMRFFESNPIGRYDMCDTIFNTIYTFYICLCR